MSRLLVFLSKADRPARPGQQCFSFSIPPSRYSLLGLDDWIFSIASLTVKLDTCRKNFVEHSGKNAITLSAISVHGSIDMSSPLWVAAAVTTLM